MSENRIFRTSTAGKKQKTTTERVAYHDNAIYHNQWKCDMYCDLYCEIHYDIIYKFCILLIGRLKCKHFGPPLIQDHSVPFFNIA